MEDPVPYRHALTPLMDKGVLSSSAPERGGLRVCVSSKGAYLLTIAELRHTLIPIRRVVDAPAALFSCSFFLGILYAILFSGESARFYAR